MAKRGMMPLSIAELERMLKDAKQEVQQLQKERTGLVDRVTEIDHRLAELGGTRKRGPKAKHTDVWAAKPATKPQGKKAGRKKMTLADHVAKILAAAKAPMSPQEITQSLKKKDISKSKYLNTQVQEILAGDKVAVRKVGRGQYVLGGSE